MIFRSEQKILFPIDNFRFLLQKEVKSPSVTVPPLSHLTSCKPSKSNLFLINCPATVASEHDLYRMLTFNVPNLMSLFHSLGRTKETVQARCTCVRFVTRAGFKVGDFSTSPNNQAGTQHLVSCLRMLMQYIRSYLPYSRLFLHPQPEDAPCLGDRDPLILRTSPVSCKRSFSFWLTELNHVNICSPLFIFMQSPSIC